MRKRETDIITKYHDYISITRIRNINKKQKQQITALYIETHGRKMYMEENTTFIRNKSRIHSSSNWIQGYYWICEELKRHGWKREINNYNGIALNRLLLLGKWTMNNWKTGEGMVQKVHSKCNDICDYCSILQSTSKRLCDASSSHHILGW